MYVCNCHTPLQTGLKITNLQHTRHSLFFNYQSPCVYTRTIYLYNKKFDWLFIVDPIWLVWHTYISHSLTHSLTHWPVHNIPDAPTKRYFFYKKITQKQFKACQRSWSEIVFLFWAVAFRGQTEHNLWSDFNHILCASVLVIEAEKLEVQNH